MVGIIVLRHHNDPAWPTPVTPPAPVPPYSGVVAKRYIQYPNVIVTVNGHVLLKINRKTPDYILLN